MTSFHILRLKNLLVFLVLLTFPLMQVNAQVGVGAKAPADAEILFDGTREMLDQKWTYWDGPRLAASLPIKWQIVDDPVDKGTAVSSNDPAGAGGKYGRLISSRKRNSGIFGCTSNSSSPHRAAIAAYICKTVMKSRFWTEIRPRMVWRP
jgi:hypothetical protein